MPEAFRTAERLVGARRQQRPRPVRPRRAVDQGAAVRRPPATSLAKGGRGRQADLTATLLTAWAYAGAGDGKKALETVDRLKGERAFNQFRDYHAGLIADVTGSPPRPSAASRPPTRRERNTLRSSTPTAASSREARQRDAAIAVYTELRRRCCRAIRSSAPPSTQLKAGKPLPPLVTIAQEGAAEVLYGLGVVGNSQGDELTAIIYLRLALHLNPEHPLALVTLADVYERLKQLRPRERGLQPHPEGSRRCGRAPTSRSARTSSCSSAARRPCAISRRSRRSGRTTSRPSWRSATCCASRKRFAEAAEAYTRAVDRIGTPDRGHWILFFYRGTSYERAKEWQGRGRPQEGAGARPRRRSRPARRRS